jgi:translin
MHNLDEIIERIRLSFEARTAARDQALAQSRSLTRYCSNAIRAVHRQERDVAEENLQEARSLVEAIQTGLSQYPDLYHAGYTQDALKEYAEARIVHALILGNGLPAPEDLGLDATPERSRRIC